MKVSYRDLKTLPICEEAHEFLRYISGGNEYAVLDTEDMRQELKAAHGALGAAKALLDFITSLGNLTAWAFVAQEAVEYVAPSLAPAARAELRSSTCRVFDAGFFEAQRGAFQFSRLFVSMCRKGVAEKVLEDVLSMLALYGEHVLRDALAMAMAREEFEKRV